MGKENVSKIFLDGEKLRRTLKDKGVSMNDLSERIGRNNTYLSNVLGRNTAIVPAIEKLICIELGVEVGTFVKQDLKPMRADSGVIAIERITKEIDVIKKTQNIILETLERVLEEQEKAYNKLGGQTTSLCRIKEMLTDLCKSDREKAVDFLKTILAGEKTLESDVIRKSQEMGIRQHELMGAKRDLDVQVSTTGYGSSQKKWWFLRR